jgi:hypothetical protein
VIKQLLLNNTTAQRNIAAMASAVGEMTIDDAWEYTKSAVLITWSKTTRRMRAAGALVVFV